MGLSRVYGGEGAVTESGGQGGDGREDADVGQSKLLVIVGEE